MTDYPMLLVLAWVLSALGQSVTESSRPAPNPDSTGRAGYHTPLAREPDDLRQELDADAAALSRVPADPLIQPDPLAVLFKPVDHASAWVANAGRLKLGSTYTFLTQYATKSPPGEKHKRQDQTSGRLDFTAAWDAYDRGSTAGSISLLVRSGTNIGISRQFNLSDSLGSGLYLNCLQGGGPQEPITVNVLYWRQDIFRKRISFTRARFTPTNT